MKIYIIAGELSGDTHAADLIVSLKSKAPNVIIRACGGQKMAEAGAEIAFDYRQTAIMGFTEVVKNIFTIRRHFRAVQQDIENFQPDQIIMVDYPGFNLRLAAKIYKNYPLYYYIAPKVWAWNTKRVKKIANYFRHVFCILPFELDFFLQNGVQASYIGNPSRQQVDAFIQKNKSKATAEEYIALLPGSRKQEVQRVLPILLETVEKLGMPYKISKASSLDLSVYEELLDDTSCLVDDTYTLLCQAKMALVTSGTATLETALFNIPQIVCYVADPISYAIAKRVVKVPYISLVNLITGEETVKELIQKDCNVQRITEEIKNLNSSEAQNKIEIAYKSLREKIGKQIPSEMAAAYLLKE